MELEMEGMVGVVPLHFGIFQGIYSLDGCKIKFMVGDALKPRLKILPQSLWMILIP